MNHSDTPEATPENPYAAPGAIVFDPPPPLQLLAERSTRLGAALLDGVIFGVAFMVPAMIGFVLFDGRPDAGVIGLALGAAAVLPVIAWNCVTLHRNGQTLAKKLLGIKVVRRNGTRCGLGRIFVARYLPVTLMGAIPFLGGLVALADALLIFRDERRCLHDEIADTIVVKA